MNVAELSIRKSVITWVMIAVLLWVGRNAYNSLPRLEDPEFTIKEAIVLTPYAGASASEVEEEVTNVVEKAIQELGQVEWIESRSSRGMSQIKVHVRDQYDKFSLPQVWDELRRKVNDAQRRLPPGAGPSIVNDDFGDVYGVYIALTGEGYSYKELYEFAKFLQRELLSAQDVKRIALYGQRPEAIYVEMQREKMAELGISPQDIYNALASKNLVADAGHITLGAEYLPVNPTGEFVSEREFANLLVSARGPESRSLVYLGDVANIRREYKEPADTLLRFDGKPAVGLAISTVQGGNVITMGESLKTRSAEIMELAPLGMETHVIAMQVDAVTESINGFVVNLVEAVAIVIVVLLIFMGLRSGLIIGFVLFLTIMGTFVFMGMQSITLERISLGALVIALGMLVDNAIVVTDGMRIKMGQGEDAVSAAKEIVGQTGVPLLGATFVAVAAFAAIGTSQDSTGEYCRSLFSVILISLTFSWVTAVTATPLLCKHFLKRGAPGGEQKDPYGGGFYTLYRRFLTTCIQFRWLTVGVVVGLFFIAGFAFTHFVKQSFFPDSTRPQFFVDFWFPEGTSIDETSREIGAAEQYLLGLDGVESAATFVGGGQIRFLLTYTPEQLYPSFAQVLLTVDDYRKIPDLIQKAQDDLEPMFPQAVIHTRQFILGPSTGGKIQLRIGGPDPEVLRNLATKAEAILADDPGSKGVRNEWRQQVKVLRPVLAEAQARQAGITRPMLAQAVGAGVEGTTVGVYRERDELLPIIARAPEWERVDFDNLGAIPIWSPVAQKQIPVKQILSGFRVEFENPFIWRRDRVKMIRIHADPRTGLPSELFARVKAPIEKALGVDVAQKVGHEVSDEEWDASTIPVRYRDRIPLKGMPGYFISWGGESEDSSKAQGGLAVSVPIFFGLMVLIVLVLFNSIQKTLIIWLTVPLALIGVTAGLLIFRQPFGFMSLLGLMSLAGMLIKNAVVLIDEIDVQLKGGRDPLEAVMSSGVSRLIPVSMAALTTILGMIPLLQDAFFISMAVTIMFGLGFATVLTLVVVPVLYTIFYRIPASAS